jgi:ABC-type sugar transport system ATPase subunit
MIYVTHDHAEAMSLADRILVLHGGRLLQAGTPEEIYRHPVDSRVARMLGRPAINIFNAAEAARLGLAEARPALPGVPGAAAAPGVVGVRPESWRVMPDPAGPAQVQRVEHLGPRVIVVLDVQGSVVRAVVPATLRIKPGDRVRLGLDSGEVLHLAR